MVEVVEGAERWVELEEIRVLVADLMDHLDVALDSETGLHLGLALRVSEEILRGQLERELCLVDNLHSTLVSCLARAAEHEAELLLGHAAVLRGWQSEIEARRAW